MSLPPPHIHRGWSLADLPGLPDEGQRYELVDGGLVVTPPATQRHQDVASDVRDRLAAAAGPGWRVRYEYALPFADDTQRVPDVVVFRWPLEHPRVDARNPLGPADVGLIVEVVSPRTLRTDRFAKPGEYAEAGIPLFWRLETDPELVLHAFALRDARYEPTAEIRGRGAVAVPWGQLVLDVPSLGS